MNNTFFLNPSIRKIQPHTAKTQNQLVCFHFAGGNAEYFMPWKKYIPEDCALYAIQLPGRSQRLREPFVTCIHENADLLCDALQDLPALTTYFFGHSMGSTLAFETALRWEESGRKLGHLMVSARIPPHQSSSTTFHLQSDEALIRRLQVLSKKAEKVFESPELKKLFLPIIRADYKTIETYQHRKGRKLSCPVSVFFGNNDEVKVEHMQEWSLVTKNDFFLYEFEGDHFYLDKHPLDFFELIEAIMQDKGGK